jgi:peroxiredoxin
MKQLPVGAVAPDFTLQLLSGREFRLSDQLAYGPLVLAFYKASCPTCQLTFPYLQRIYSELGNNTKYRIVGISQDDPAETKDFVDGVGIGFDVAIDEHPYSVSSTYGLEFVPTIFLIGRDGKIQLSDYGFSKATLLEIAGPLQLFSPEDGLPAIRPG